MSKKSEFAISLHDFAKSNGSDRLDHDAHPGGPSLTRQEFAEECDINTIMARYDSYLADPMRSVREPVYYDFTSVPDNLMDAMQMIREGEEAFMRLPAEVRREFDNDPAMFVDFAADPEHLEQMRSWGLAKAAEKAPEPLAVRVIPEPPAPPVPPKAPPGPPKSNADAM